MKMENKIIKKYELQDMERAISQRIAVKSRTPPISKRFNGFKKKLLTTKWYLEDEETLLIIFYHDELGVVSYQFYKKKR
ncbi:hypothetical protein GCM10017706_15660 [Lactococcus lactis subsp. hordniae]|uniref:Uncharacterized protein n=3 Tax=Lactococcus lactis TaxID=1358 RepID=A0A2A5SJY6_LACLH|nr:hypothetical protein [Lactococcus lactis]PCS13703.1 hypothetical protein RU90_GL002087 [Lactococcus lactis subsp. hordniae]